MTDWPKYESHKIVQAAKITRIEEINSGSGIGILQVRIIWVRPDGAPEEEFVPTEPAMVARAEVGGYAMLYPDGFKSISPAKAFEDGYTRV